MSSEVQDDISLKIPKGWTIEALIDCTVDRQISYGIVQPGQNVESGVPIVRVNNFKDGRLEIEDVLRVAPEISSKYKRTILEGGEVLLTLVGSTGQSAIAPKTLAGWNVPRAIAVIRPKPEIGSKWINICLQSQYAKDYLDVRANTTVQKTLNLKDVRELPILLPLKAERKKIETIVDNLNDKIENNRATNQTLEQIAQAIFKSWFVDFEPTKAKIAALEAGGSEADALVAAMQAISGKTEPELTQLQANHPDQYAELRATAELFPSAMQESELGEIPEGWDVTPLSRAVTLIGGGTPKKSQSEFWGGDIPWFSIKDVPANGNIFVIDTEEKITRAGLNGSSTKLLPVGTTIITARGTVGKLALTAVPVSMNQSCYGVVACDESGPFFNYLRVKNALSVLKRNTHGAVFDTITRDTFDTVTQLRPCLSLRLHFDNVVAPIFERIKSNLLESSSIETVRNILLPKLLSGEISLLNSELNRARAVKDLSI